MAEWRVCLVPLPHPALRHGVDLSIQGFTLWTLYLALASVPYPRLCDHFCCAASIFRWPGRAVRRGRARGPRQVLVSTVAFRDLELIKIKIKIKIKKGLGLHTTSEIYSVNNWKYSTRLPSPSSHLLRGCVASESSNK